MIYNIDKIKAEIDETTNFLKSKGTIKPEIGIILGTGLGGLVNEIKILTSIEYNNIPNFPISTVDSHSGKMIYGELNGKNVLVMQGRFHYYEGYEMYRITFPIRVMKSLGIRNLLISNACGALNPIYKKGDLMIIDDHINFLGDNPLIGINTNEFGPRFVDMSEPYSQELIKISEQIGLDNKIKLHKGVYCAMTGPSLETRAEYRFLRIIGADVIGMSTIPECIVANQIGIKVFGLSIITDECFPDNLQPVNVEEIIEVANETEPKMTLIFKELIRLI